ncbi:hypothetical protein [Erythrobacter aureus]|uniref:Uncharacterized protein n=1 Tax=Erythrobacter aureus TaxID=2182384 RepID=A0A345YDT3_9SPHN|nr:hypothetical protein [Erythrobacter aureus]AXK42085.1 hypothetical protein DVR09_06800 [Erythrobacter aureus]MBL44638.1 hypothetical protein [Sphingomonadaceae bacterium]
MHGSEITSFIVQAVAVIVVISLLALPYLAFRRAKSSFVFCIKLACAEAVLLAAWLVFATAIVAPVSISIAMQALAFGVIAAALVLALWWLFCRRMRSKQSGE